MPEEKQLIQPVAIERDEHGFWTHPAWPSTEEELIPYAWFYDRGLDVKQVEFEYDAPKPCRQPDTTTERQIAPAGTLRNRRVTAGSSFHP